MKLHQLSLPHGNGNGPLTPTKGPREHTRDDVVEKYRKDRLAFIEGMKGSLELLGGIGSVLLVNLSQDPESDVALAACQAVNHILEHQGPLFDIHGTLDTLSATLKTIAGKRYAEKQAALIQKEVYLAMEVIWCTLDVGKVGDVGVTELARRCAAACDACLNDVGASDDVRTAAVRAVAASCQRHTEDCLGAIQGILNAAKLSITHAELQEQAFRLFVDKSGALPPETLDDVIHHAAAWLRHYADSPTDHTTNLALSRQAHEAALGAIASFLETTIALGSISSVIDEDLCALLCVHAEAAINAIDQSNDAMGTEAYQSATVVMQVLARLVNEREIFSRVVAEKRSLLETICASCLKDVESPMLLPALFCIGHVSKASSTACRLISLDLREEKGIDTTSALVVALAHGKQGTIRQVAAWVLGVLGSSSAAGAQYVAAAGGLLTLMDAIKNDDPNGTLATTCNEACIVTVSRLESLDTLVALLTLDGLTGCAGGDVNGSPVPPRVQETLFERIARLLEDDISLRTKFVQQGALEALISLGETRPELDAHMMNVCNLYPQELVNRCSPKYMQKLIEKFKRESCCMVERRASRSCGEGSFPAEEEEVKELEPPAAHTDE